MEIEKAALYRCMTEPEFSKILTEDAVLDELEAAKFDRRQEFFSLCLLFRGIFTICGVPVQPLTPAVWSFLWVMENAYTIPGREKTAADTDFFLFVLSKGLRWDGFSASKCYAESLAFCQKRGIDYQEAEADLKNMVCNSLRPLEMVPRRKTDSSEFPVYDADWLTDLCSVTAREANCRADFAMFDMSLFACYSYYVQDLRKRDTKGRIKRQTDTEINKAMIERCIELGKTYYKKRHGGAEHGN